MTRSLSTHRIITSPRRRAFLPQAEGLEARQLLSAGELDTTFGVSGLGFTLAGPGAARAVQLQADDGKILAAGRSGDGNDFRLVRLGSSGAPDPTFGTSGSVTTDFAGGTDLVTGMAILPAPDNRIVVVGRVVNFYTLPGKGNKPVTYSNNDIGLACYLAADTTISGVLYKAGDLDPRFGTGGKVMTNIRTTDGVKSADYANGVIVQDDGKIVVGGMTTTTSGTWDAVLVRYNADGSLDDGFGSHGIVQTHLATSTSNGVWDLTLLRDPTNPANDKIVTMEAPLTNGQYSVMVARYNILDGSPDTNFSTDGRSDIATLLGHSLGDWEMALQTDGSAVVTGYDFPTNSPNGSFLLRYTNTGQLDPTFGTDGSGIILFGAATGDIAYSVAIQPNDKIVVAGTSNTTPGSFVARFDTHGAIDPTFGALVNPANPSGSRTGYARDIFTNAGSSFQSSHSLILQPDGQIVVGGNGTTSTTTIVHGKPQTTSLTQFLIARYQGDPVAPLSASMALPGSVTSIGPSAATGQSEVLIPLTDHDLSQLATEVILIRPKRRGAPRP
jgi:uncharacterized delta-60 repeat protein